MMIIGMKNNKVEEKSHVEGGKSWKSLRLTKQKSCSFFSTRMKIEFERRSKVEGGDIL
jgi:hypothetical protein